MIVVTNRNLQPDRTPARRFGKDFNAEGPDELRLAEASRDGRGRWKLEILPDGRRRGRRLMPCSEVVFLELQKTLRTTHRDVLLFVHGYNNGFRDVLERGWRLQETYGLEVVCFSWPSDGDGGRGPLRGRLGGTLAYKSDRNDAVRSVPALDRTLQKLAGYLGAHRDERCGGRVSLLLHSMGCYLFEQLLKSEVYEGETRVFDNIVLCAADVDNQGHESWLDRVLFRRRLYVTINEDDLALNASRTKHVSHGGARLGAFSRNLLSRKAVYVDFTGAAHVGASHTYFEGNPVRRNPVARAFFERALHGQRAEEELLEIQPSLYRVP